MLAPASERHRKRGTEPNSSRPAPHLPSHVFLYSLVFLPLPPSAPHLSPVSLSLPSPRLVFPQTPSPQHLICRTRPPVSCCRRSGQNCCLCGESASRKRTKRDASGTGGPLAGPPFSLPGEQFRVPANTATALGRTGRRGSMLCRSVSVETQRDQQWQGERQRGRGAETQCCHTTISNADTASVGVEAESDWSPC